MFCGKCGHDNADGAEFCGSCGAPLLARRHDSHASRAATEAGDGTMRADLSSATAGKGAERLGPYELRGELGHGAMAVVWRAWDPNLSREVAIKEPTFDPHAGSSMLEEMGRRFVQEAKIAAKLDHPGIVALHAADIYDGRPAIVMELVQGVTLRQLLEQGPLPEDQTVDILEQLLDAVGYAHEHGVIHRDIKPDNIFITKSGRVKLADFGIARAEDENSETTTRMGVVLGTPGYMSPEQALGRPVDARSDLFSIGTVAYEMLSGRKPFGSSSSSDTTALIYRIVHEPAPELPKGAGGKLPSTLRAAIMAALEKEPDKRPQSAAEFKALLRGKKTRVAVRRGGAPSWLPYAAVAGVGIMIVLFLLLSAGGANLGGAQ